MLEDLLSQCPLNVLRARDSVFDWPSMPWKTIAARAIRVGSLSVLCVCYSGCAAALSEDSGSSGRPALRMSWRPTCMADHESEFFSVAIYADGFVRYTGSDQMKTTDKESARISVQQVEKLLRAVARYRKVDAPLPGAVATPSATLYCISVTLSTGQAIQVGEGANSYMGQAYSAVLQELRSLDRLAEESVSVKRWACPTRADGLYATRFCGEAMLFLTFEDRESCGYHHVVDVYPDGSMQYYIGEVSGSTRNYQLTPQQLRAIDHALRPLGMSEMVVDAFEGGSKQGPPPNKLERVYNSSGSVGRIRESVAQIAGIDWRDVDAPDKPCHPRRDSYPFPQGWAVVSLPAKPEAGP